jgi:competence protein ComEA
VGPALAERIVRWREREGPFRSVEDLARVPGIGPATVARIRGSVRVSP